MSKAILFFSGLLMIAMYPVPADASAGYTMKMRSPKNLCGRYAQLDLMTPQGYKKLSCVDSGGKSELVFRKPDLKRRRACENMKTWAEQAGWNVVYKKGALRDTIELKRKGLAKVTIRCATASEEFKTSSGPVVKATVRLYLSLGPGKVTWKKKTKKAAAPPPPPPAPAPKSENNEQSAAPPPPPEEAEEIASFTPEEAEQMLAAEEVETELDLVQSQIIYSYGDAQDKRGAWTAQKTVPTDDWPKGVASCWQWATPVELKIVGQAESPLRVEFFEDGARTARTEVALVSGTATVKFPKVNNDSQFKIYDTANQKLLFSGGIDGGWCD